MEPVELTIEDIEDILEAVKAGNLSLEDLDFVDFECLDLSGVDPDALTEAIRASLSGQ